MFEKAQERLNVCMQCSSYTEKKNCNECKCYVPAKVLIPLTKCPLGKWKEN